MKKVLVWDLPTRLFHWALVVLLCLSFITAVVEDLENTELHMASGYGILGLVLFRLGWGFFGGTYARFTQFLRGPKTCVTYLKQIFPRRSNSYPEIESNHDSYLGHNPLGGWMTIVMLLVTLIQITTGLFANDDILYEGPLAYKVTEYASSQFTVRDKQNYLLLLFLIILHLAAIGFYRFFKQQHLEQPMVTGYKQISTRTAQLLNETQQVATNWGSAKTLMIFEGLIVCIVIYWL